MKNIMISKKYIYIMGKYRAIYSIIRILYVIKFVVS